MGRLRGRATSLLVSPGGLNTGGARRTQSLRLTDPMPVHRRMGELRLRVAGAPAGIRHFRLILRSRFHPMSWGCIE